MKRMHYRSTFGAALAVLLCATSSAFAQTAPSLGNAAPFAVLAGSTVTNTGPTNVAGNVGVSPGAAIVGFPPGTISAGSVFHAANATSAAAQVSLTTAYNDLAGQAPTQNLTGQDLGALGPLVPGVYKFDTSAQLTGTLQLNAQGNANAVFIFQIGSTLTTASASTVELINGGSLCNVFWQVGSSATLGTTTNFIGNILAQASITLNTGARVGGRLLARTAAVTLDTNIISAAACVSGVSSPGTCPVIGITPEVLPGGTVGVPYSVQIRGNSGTAPYTYSTTAANLPGGLTLSSTGLLSGTPTSPDAQTFVVRATDALVCSSDRTYVFRIGVGVPTMPQWFLLLLGIGVLAIGYLRLRRPAQARS
jgi:hypothetical protein